MLPSPQTANQVHSIFTWISIGALIIGLIAAIVGAISDAWRTQHDQSEKKALRNDIVQARGKAAQVASELEKLTTPRHLTAAQLADLVASLGQFHGQHVELGLSSSAVEAKELTNQLEGALKTAGLTVRTWMIPVGDKGVTVTVTGEAPTHFAHVFRQTLERAGVAVTVHRETDRFEKIRIIVGEKP